MPDSNAQPQHVICIGAGPAGLTAAYKLSAAGVKVTLLERDPVHVGGISRTETYKGFRFDVGGHRFFSRSQEIEDLWDEILGDELITRPRKSRIFYQGKLFDYPLRAFDALTKLGIFESVFCVLSYLKVQLFPIHNPQTFEDWVTNQFGRRLFNIFFKSYTEKVWGMRCEEISADWAAQRIKGLSLGGALRNALIPAAFRREHKTPKTLVEQFRYPRLGPGQMWEAVAEKVSKAGGEVLLGMEVNRLVRNNESGEWTIGARDPEGQLHEFHADQVISSVAISELAEFLEPRLPEPVLTAARALRYRDFVTVALIIKDVDCFDDNWIYIHDSSVKVGRIQNFKSWSPHLVPDPELNCLGLEYFCFKGDGLWDAKDEDLVRLADEELIQLGLVTPGHVIDGTVIRQPKAYPVYNDSYEERVALFRSWLEKHMPELHLVGRNGMHKYNNQDHAMMTALLTAENILAGERLWDVWRVNQDADYHEIGEDRSLAFSERAVPRSISG
ncbi:MAG TPA: NAD(P)/FAD-dependent oxidoreductase [Xanthomonadales bacterium]|nr:NAD(P)/FAD-dependent oxidoreductase [Xanthomonadales bacterium]